jgi:hypothetical protein
MSSAIHSIGSRSCTRSLLWLSAAVLAAWAGGCHDSSSNPQVDAAATPSDGAGGATPPSTCPPAAGTVDPTALIDNFEGRTNNLIPNIGGRVGGWFALGDGTPSGILQPIGNVAPEVIDGGRCASRHGLHLTGAGFLDWGAQLLTPLSYGAGDGGVAGFLPYDGSHYQGISFFARIGDTSSASVRFAVADEYSRPEAGRCVLGGDLQTACYDARGVDLSPSIGTEWREFQIPFSGLFPQNVGLHSSALDATRIYDVQFNFAPHSVFDFWIDDISFY